MACLDIYTSSVQLREITHVVVAAVAGVTTGEVIADERKIRVLVSGGEGDRQSQRHYSCQDEFADTEMKRIFL